MESSSEDITEERLIPPREEFVEVYGIPESLEDYDFVTLRYSSKVTDPVMITSQEFIASPSTNNVVTSVENFEDNSTFETTQVLDHIDKPTQPQGEPSVPLKENIESFTSTTEGGLFTDTFNQDTITTNIEDTYDSKSVNDELTTVLVTDGSSSDDSTSFSQNMVETSPTELHVLTDTTIADTETSTLVLGTTGTTSETEWFEDYVY